MPKRAALTPAEHKAIVESDPDFLALRDFVFHVYPQRDYPYSTSWSTYAICPTEEEELLGAVVEKLYPEEEYPDFLKILPELAMLIVFAHATKQSQVDAAIKFTTDAIDDLMRCHIRESDLAISEDTEDTSISSIPMRIVNALTSA